MNSPLDAATSTVGVAPIYAFANGIAADGSPNFVDGQHNVIDLLPGDEGYSDLWQVHIVLVDDDYEAGTITSKAGIDATRYQKQVTNLLVNCPVVGAGSTLETGKELVNGYYRDRDVFYPDFGGNVAVAIPIWAFVTGFDDDGNPQFVEGQRYIIDAVPADEGYSAFWRVNLVMVDDSYEANSLKSREDVEGSGARGGADGPRGQLPGGRADVARSFATTLRNGRPGAAVPRRIEPRRAPPSAVRRPRVRCARVPRGWRCTRRAGPERARRAAASLCMRARVRSPRGSG